METCTIFPHYNTNGISDILDIHEYLMKKHDMI